MALTRLKLDFRRSENLHRGILLRTGSCVRFSQMRLPPQTEIGGTTEWIRNLGPSGGENRMNRSMRSSAEWLQEIEISFLTLSLSLFLATLARVGTGF